MGALSWIGFAAVCAVCAVVSFFCGGTLLRRDGRLDSLRQFEWWRLIPCAVLLGLLWVSVVLPRQSQLRCERAGAGVACTIEQRQLRRSFHRELPPGSLRGSEVQVTTGTDQDGHPEQQTRLWLVTSDGKHLLTDYGHADAERLHDDLARFLADPSQRTIVLGQDNRWFFYPQGPMWLLLVIYALIGRL